MIGQIICNISDLYRVKYDGGCVDCKARGIFKNKQLKPLVGDKVIVDVNQKIIDRLLPRINELIRPPICNVDQALVVVSVKDPDLDLYLLDKLISIITYNNINIIICFTKLDLLNEKERDIINNYIGYYNNIGYKVIDNTKIDELKNLLKNKITVLTGQSGVGKSSLLNKIDASLNLKTDDISYALGRGKHTTRHVELLMVDDAFIADTPGFSSLDLNEMSRENIRDTVIEFNKYRSECKYRDCFHLKEDDCKIKDLVKSGVILESRYNNYQKFMQEDDVLDGKNIRFHSVKK